MRENEAIVTWTILDGAHVGDPAPARAARARDDAC